MHAAVPAGRRRRNRPVSPARLTRPDPRGSPGGESDGSTGSLSGESDGSPGPLAGLVVADFSRILAGPLATMMLGDLGAEVIKVERPGAGDDTRSWGPPFAEDGFSAYYLSVNRNKRSIALDLGDERQRARARELVRAADVVIENFRAGTMERFGLDYESSKADNPGLIYCRISGFGNGAGRDLPGYDFLVQALSGLMSITGHPDGPPMKTGVAIVDVLTGLHAAVGVLAAVAERQRSGLGQRLEVNLFSSALASLVNQASSYLTAGSVPARMSNQHPSVAPYETLATATGPIVIAVGNDGQFRNLCAALGRPDLAADDRWASNAGRVRHRDELVAELEAALGERPGEDWVGVLRGHEIPCGAVQDISEAFELADRLGLDPVRRLVRDGGAGVAGVANPITLSRTPASYRLAPPGLGADTDRVLEWLDSRPGPAGAVE